MLQSNFQIFDVIKSKRHFKRYNGKQIEKDKWERFDFEGVIEGKIGKKSDVGDKRKS